MLPRRGAILLLTAALASAAGAASSSAITAAGDFALLHDGSRHEGPVRACVGDRCRIGSDDLEREVIAWLGLGVALDAAPPPLEGDGDAVVLADGTVVRASVVGVSAGLVVTAAGEHERAAVRWIRFAPAGGGDAAGGVVTRDRDDGGPPDEIGDDRDDGDDGHDGDDDGDGDRGDEDGDDRTHDPVDPPIEPDDGDRDRGQTDPPIEPPGDGPGGGDPPGGRDVDDPRPPNDPPVSACPADAPLGGHIVLDHRHRSSIDDCSGTYELWFDLAPYLNLDIPLLATWPGSLHAGYDASEIVYQLRSHGCSPVEQHLGCTAPGKSASGTVRSAGPLDPLGLHFDPVAPSLEFSALPDEIHHNDILATQVTCTNGFHGWVPVVGGSIYPHEEGNAGVPGVQPTLCYMTNDEARHRDCILHPDRYAVVPFRGEQREWRDAGDNGLQFDERKLRWDVCCGCGRPPSGPPPEFDPRGDPCADAEARQEQIVRRMRTARELYEFAERDKVCAETRRDAATAHRFGRGGEYAEFFAALGGFAAEFQPGAGSDFFGLLFALAAVANEPGRESIDEAALEAATSDTFQELARDGHVRAAVHEMVVEFDRTGDAAGALAGFRQRMSEIASGFDSASKILKVLTVGMAMKSFYDAAKGVCDNWSLEQAWQRELWDAENEMSAADQRWNEAEVELQVLRRSCPDLPPAQVPPAEQQPPAVCPLTPQGQPVSGCGIFTASGGAAADAPRAAESRSSRAPTSRGVAESSIVRASFAPESPTPAASDPAATAASLAELGELGEALATVENRLSELAPLVLLFSPDLEITVPRVLLGAAAAAAVEVGDAVKTDAALAIELARTLEPTLREQGTAGPTS